MRAVFIIVWLLAGCASRDCAADAYELGQRDGVLAAEQGARLASRCGSTFDTARYREGYREGYARRPPPVDRR